MWYVRYFTLALYIKGACASCRQVQKIQDLWLHNWSYKHSHIAVATGPEDFFATTWQGGITREDRVENIIIEKLMFGYAGLIDNFIIELLEDHSNIIRYSITSFIIEVYIIIP
ncbi:hypothetical protein ACJX0J_024386 [Zea mays]